jgi:hypothetical protein
VASLSNCRGEMGKVGISTMVFGERDRRVDLKVKHNEFWWFSAQAILGWKNVSPKHSHSEERTSHMPASHKFVHRQSFSLLPKLHHQRHLIAALKQTLAKMGDIVPIVTFKAGRCDFGVRELAKMYERASADS